MSVRLTNHIAYRFLNDDSLTWEIMELHFPELHNNIEALKRIEEALDKRSYDTGSRESQMIATYQVLSHLDNKNYYITDSVTENLELLKVNRDAEGRYDYTIFKNLQAQKRTFIMPDNKLVRMLVTEREGDRSQMVFEYLKFERYKNDKNQGHMNSCMFYVNRITGEQCSHFQHPDVKEIEDYLYKLLCFIYLSDTEEVILKPGEKMGTRKSGKLINEVKHPLVVVTSKWNVTSIRTEGFAVRGHFRLQPYGEGRSEVRVKWINPFEKHGYVRTAKKELET